MRSLGGTALTYDAAGQRHTALNSKNQLISIWNPHAYMSVETGEWVGDMQQGNYTLRTLETYDYDAAGRLDTVRNATGAAYWVEVDFETVDLVYEDPVGPGGIVGTFDYDLMGRMTLQTDYGGVVAYGFSGASHSRALGYNAKGQVTSEDVSTVKVRYGTSQYDTFRSVTTYAYGSGSGYALGSVVSQTAVNTKLASGSSSWSSQPGTATTTSYEWFDGAVQTYISHDYDTGSSSNPLYTTDLQLNALAVDYGDRCENP